MKSRRIQFNLDLPKITGGSPIDNPKLKSGYEKRPKCDNDKENIPETKMKEFIKQFKNSHSSARILKISPYCNNLLKNKLLSALADTKNK